MAAVRVILGAAESSRLELRLPGANSNPYLVAACAVAAVDHGLIDQLEPARPQVGDLPPSDARALPTTLEAATVLLEADPIAQAMIDERFTHYYANTRRWELGAWQRAVSDWEIDRYGAFP